MGVGELGSSSVSPNLVTDFYANPPMMGWWGKVVEEAALPNANTLSR